MYFLEDLDEEEYEIAIKVSAVFIHFWIERISKKAFERLKLGWK